MSDWTPALRLAAETLASRDLDWLVVGSAASALRGCAFAPNDLDLLFPDLATLSLAARLLDEALDSAERHPIITQTWSSGFRWHKLRLEIGGFPLDASYIESGGGIPDSPDGDGIWEGGFHVWNYIERVPFEGLLVPVPHLCIQLESQLRRALPDRAAEIRRVLELRGYDREIAARCLSQENFRFLIDGELPPPPVKKPRRGRPRKITESP